MRNVAHVRPLLASATALVVVVGLAACAPGSDDPNAVTIRVAMGSSGDAVDDNFEVLKEQLKQG